MACCASIWAKKRTRHRKMEADESRSNCGPRPTHFLQDTVSVSRSQALPIPVGTAILGQVNPQRLQHTYWWLYKRSIMMCHTHQRSSCQSKAFLFRNFRMLYKLLDLFTSKIVTNALSEHFRR